MWERRWSASAAGNVPTVHDCLTHQRTWTIPLTYPSSFSSEWLSCVMQYFFPIATFAWVRGKVGCEKIERFYAEWEVGEHWLSACLVPERTDLGWQKDSTFIRPIIWRKEPMEWASVCWQASAAAVCASSSWDKALNILSGIWCVTCILLFSVPPRLPSVHSEDYI